MSTTNTDCPIATCPECGQEESDLDGFGILVCDHCGYCSHTSQAERNGVMTCDLCGEIS